MGVGIVGDDNEVGARLRTIGIAPLQLEDRTKSSVTAIIYGCMQHCDPTRGTVIDRERGGGAE